VKFNLHLQICEIEPALTVIVLFLFLRVKKMKDEGEYFLFK